MKTLSVTSPVPVSPVQSEATTRAAKTAATRATSEPRLLQWFLIALALGAMGLILIVPLFVVFTEAFSQGLELYKASIINPDALSAVRLTLLVALVAVPINTVFGIAAAWAITRFHFRGKGALLTLLDLPFAVSPIISGLIFVLMFGRRGIFGPYLQAHDWKIIFA
ncbi:sulfate/thiosulfate ABC transporter permease CysW, partial [bacterium]